MQSDRITERAAWHKARFAVPPDVALDRARREFALAEFWTPWELRGSRYAEEWLHDYVARSMTTAQ